MFKAKAATTAYTKLQEFEGFTSGDVPPAVPPGTFGAKNTKAARKRLKIDKMPPKEPQPLWNGAPATVRQYWEQQGIMQLLRRRSAGAMQRHRA